MKKNFLAGLSVIALLALSAPALTSTGKQDREVVPVATCASDYAELKNAMLRVYGRVLYVSGPGTTRLSLLFADGDWGPIDHFIVGTHEATRTMDVLIFKCSKLLKSWVQMSVEDFDKAQSIWQITRDEMLTWGRPS